MLFGADWIWLVTEKCVTFVQGDCWWQQLWPSRLDLSWMSCILLLQCKHPSLLACNSRYFTWEHCLLGRLFLVPSQTYHLLCLKTNAYWKNSDCRIRQSVVTSVIWCDSGWDSAALMDFLRQHLPMETGRTECVSFLRTCVFSCIIYILGTLFYWQMVWGLG